MGDTDSGFSFDGVGQATDTAVWSLRQLRDTEHNQPNVVVTREFEFCT